MLEEDTAHERWFVSYSDLLTLLFAVFVVLFAAEYRNHESVQSFSSAVQHGLNQMGAFSAREGPASQEARHNPTSSSKASALAASAANSASDLKHQLEQALGKEIENGTVSVSETREGVVVSVREAGFFGSGQARLLPTAVDSIERIAAPLIRSGFSIRVEGHSDNVPIHNARFSSNLDLSTARAMAVGIFLETTAGYDPSRVSVAGYGEYRPVASNATPEGRRANRRVDIVVLTSAGPSAPEAQ